MSAPPLRPVVTPILGVVAAALCAATALICAGAALADSKPPPPETTSHTGTLVVVGCIVIAVVLAAVIVLRRVARSRRDNQIYEEYAERRQVLGPPGLTPWPRRRTNETGTEESCEDHGGHRAAHDRGRGRCRTRLGRSGPG